jgi:AraC family transcriptional regulator
MSVLFHIKNMVCDRCKLVVKDSFEKAGAQVLHLTLGEVQIAQPLDIVPLNKLTTTLESLGFELLEDKQTRTVEKIKTLVIQLIYSNQLTKLKINLSDYLSEQLHRDYSGLSTLFSSHEGITIEQYMIRQKIERVKELLTYDQQSMSQIADDLQYSSVAHLSNQFKKVTGLTPSQYKASNAKNRLALDQV